MIGEAIDVLITLGWAALAWITVLAAALTVVLLTGCVVGAWAVQGAWRTVRAATPRQTGPAPAGAPHSPSRDSSTTEPRPEPAHERTAPQLAHAPQETPVNRKKTGRRISGDPCKSGGDIAGPGGPHDRNAVIIDTTDAVLLDSTDVCLMETSNGTPVLAMLLEGRINKTTDRARNLYLLNEDGAAALVTELLALAHRIGPEFGARFTARLEHLLDTEAFTGQQGDRQ